MHHREPETVPVRTIWGTQEDGSSWLISARMFGSLRGGVVAVWISCPSAHDAPVEFRKLVATTCTSTLGQDRTPIDAGPSTPFAKGSLGLAGVGAFASVLPLTLR